MDSDYNLGGVIHSIYYLYYFYKLLIFIYNYLYIFFVYSTYIILSILIYNSTLFFYTVSYLLYQYISNFIWPTISYSPSRGTICLIYLYILYCCIKSVKYIFAQIIFVNFTNCRSRPSVARYFSIKKEFN